MKKLKSQNKISSSGVSQQQMWKWDVFAVGRGKEVPWQRSQEVTVICDFKGLAGSNPMSAQFHSLDKVN